MSDSLLPVVIPSASTAIVPISDTLKSAFEAAQRFVAMATADNTLRAYTADWADFADWCARQQLASLPARPETVGLYCAALAEIRKISTITRRLAAIAKQHRNAGYDSPASMRHSAVHDVIAGMRRDRGTRRQSSRRSTSTISKTVTTV
jgi:hypothetical protein